MSSAGALAAGTAGAAWLAGLLAPMGAPDGPQAIEPPTPTAPTVSAESRRKRRRVYRSVMLTLLCAHQRLGARHWPDLEQGAIGAALEDDPAQPALVVARRVVVAVVLPAALRALQRRARHQLPDEQQVLDLQRLLELVHIGHLHA